MNDINARLSYLDDTQEMLAYSQKRSSVRDDFKRFLKQLPHSPVIGDGTPEDIRKYLVFKDSCGKTQVHVLLCPNMGKTGLQRCLCPRRLASGTVAGIVQHLKSVYEFIGKGRIWFPHDNTGNPACAPEVRLFLKAIKVEQASSHVLPKQSKPLFVRKLRLLSIFIRSRLDDLSISSRDRFIFARDQAFFKIQFFGGDRAGDLTLTKLQEVKQLPGDDGVLLSHSFGKTLRGDGKVNCFALKPCEDHVICPVRGLQLYFSTMKGLGVFSRHRVPFQDHF
ncbi:unnamed protein product [Owenia fusiformis]|uniref:ALOG domain-containing protein n=1 Tax=Owenia fusiformis TaxID=6347 RepID=A0A8S4Q786_OWEFU|nr:unnamed protein product [Owenia fusiformis]